MKNDIEVLGIKENKILHIDLQSKRRLYLRAILGTKLENIEEEFKDYIDYFSNGQCFWDKEKLLKLSENKLIDLYNRIDAQIEHDYIYKKDKDYRL